MCNLTAHLLLPKLRSAARQHLRPNAPGEGDTMASAPSSSVPSRAGRVATNHSRQQPPAQPARSLVVPSAGPLSSGSGAFALGSPSAVPGNINQPSNLELFLANLRILDLDLLEDWPGITAQTFGSSAAGQKRRIQAVEWSLYHLFSLWDPQEAQTASFTPPFPSQTSPGQR